MSAGVLAQDSGIKVCDPQQSVLCQELREVFEFEEATDSTGSGSVSGGQFHEATGQNVAMAPGKLGRNAVSFTGTEGKYLYLSRAGGFGNNLTGAMWIYPTSSTARQSSSALTSRPRTGVKPQIG